MEISDTERLDFMMIKRRQVIAENNGWGSEGRHFLFYVEEGVMGDRVYPAVEFTAEDYDQESEEVKRLKREAIDLAINETKE